MKAKFTTKKIPYCVVFNPEADKQNLFVAGMADKKMICVSIFNDSFIVLLLLFIFISGIQDQVKLYKNMIDILAQLIRLHLLIVIKES
jgi:hypothetical protein